MADRTFDSIVPRVSPSVPGCPQAMQVNAIREAAIRVCERTLAWRATLAPLTLTGFDNQYSYITPADTSVVAVLSATINARPISFLTLDDATAAYPDWTAEGVPLAMTQLTPDRFALLPAHDNAEPYVLQLRVALRPTRTSAGMDSGMVDELEDTIMHGALQQLLAVPKTNWEDKATATYHARQYLFGITGSRARANLGNMRGAMTVTMAPWA